jgi:4-amino-4-deoxy-L-arabinose transferase-like glycosyltransferase
MTWLLPVALFASLVHGIAHVYIRAPESPDAAEYMALGKSLATRGELILPSGERAKRMPLYPVMISLFCHGQSDEKLESDVLAAQCVMAIATSILLGGIAWMLADRRAGILAILISALYAPHLYLQTLCLSETLLIFFLVVTLLSYLCFLKSDNARRWIALSLAALAMAAASLTRANAAILALPFLIDCLLRPGQWRLRFTRATILLLPLASALIAWGLRNQSQIGAFTLSTTGGLNFYLGHNEHYARDPGLSNADYGAFDRLRRETGASEVKVDQLLLHRGQEFARNHVGEEFLDSLRKLIVYHSSTIAVTAPTLLLLILGALAFSGTTREPGAAARRPFPIRHSLFALILIVWIAVFARTFRPWINPYELIPLGLISLASLRTKSKVRGLFVCLYLAEMLVAIAFIPLVRLRWTVDFLLILSIAIAVSRLCDWNRARATEK